MHESAAKLSSICFITGTITVEELRDALATMDKKLPADEVANLLQDVDMNESGAIDYEEFLAATLHASKIATDEHLKRAFQEFDADNSGVTIPVVSSTSMGHLQ